MTEQLRRHPRAKGGKRTGQLKKAVLDAYRTTLTVSHACEAAGVGRATFYDWLNNDAEFAKAVGEVETAIADKLEKEAIRRAVEGVKEPVGFYQGQAGEYVQRYSDTLLIFLLKGHKPRKFGDKAQLELSGPNGGPIAVTPIPKFETAKEFAEWVRSQQPSAKR